MNLDHIDYFIQIVDLHSITKVAEKNHFSQSALSQIVQRLEEDLGTTLLLRSNRGVVATEAGRLFYESALSIRDAYVILRGRMKSHLSRQISVVIRHCSSLDNPAMPLAVHRFQMTVRNIRTDVQAASHDRILGDLRTGTCDFGMFLCEIDDLDDLDSTIVGQERIVLVSSKESNLPAKMTMAEFAHRRIISYASGSYAKQLSDLFAASKLPMPDPWMNLASQTAILSLITNGLGVAFLPHGLVKDAVKDGFLRLTEVEGIDLSYPLKIVTRQDDRMTPEMQKIKRTFIAIVRQMFS